MLVILADIAVSLLERFEAGALEDIMEEGLQNLLDEGFEVNVSSSAIRTVAYKPKDENLDIGFTDGTSYSYWGVPAPVVAGLLSAGSIGSYFNRNIRNDYG